MILQSCAAQRRVGVIVVRHYAAPGRYRLRAKIDGLYPRCQDAAVTIRKGRMARAEPRCDSGMR